MKKTIKFLSVLLSLCLLAAFLPAFALADQDDPIYSGIPDTYAVYNSADGSLTFCYGTLDETGVVRSNGEGTVTGSAFYGAFTDILMNDKDEVETNVPWYSIRPDVETVYFLDEIAPTYTANWFNGFENLTQIVDIEKLNTANVESMQEMFCGCSALQELDVSHFNTENVEDMSAMFAFCAFVPTLDVSHFNTSKVCYMNGMFAYCSSLTTLNLSNFNTENVESLYIMFGGCSALTSLDLSNFNTEQVSEMGAMFQDCSALTTLDISSFDTSNNIDFCDMFDGCPNLSSIRLGPNFRFFISYYEHEQLYVDYAGLSYLGKWYKVGGDGTLYTSQELMDNYDGATMAGIWMWEGLTPAKDLADATVTVADQTYTGQEVRPPVVVTFGDVTLTEGTDYTSAYANNTEIGTGTVTVFGIGDYTGSKTVTFEITEPSSISRAEITVHAINGENGTVIPDVTVTMDDDTLIPDTDYTVDYTFDPETRRGTVTITGIGAFNDSITFSFEIPEEGEAIINPPEDPDVTRLGFFDWILRLIRKITEFCRSIVAMFH